MSGSRHAGGSAATPIGSPVAGDSAAAVDGAPAFLRRSPLANELAALGARFAAVGDASIAQALGADDAAETAAFSIVDLSPLPRVGYKGWNAWQRLAALGVAVPEANNTAATHVHGGLCLRLGDAEALLLPDPLAGTLRPGGIDSLADDEGFYRVPRRDTHAWLALFGTAVPAVLARACGVDFRLSKFPDRTVAQTMVARIGAIVVRWDRGGRSVYHLLADSMSARYLWKSLGDISADAGGRYAGLDALQRYSSETA